METSDIFSLVNEFTFALTGVIIAIIALRKKREEKVYPSPPFSIGELMATILALAVAAIGPNILVVALTPGMPEMPFLTKVALLPSIGLLLLVFLLAKKMNYIRLSDRIIAGLWIGAVASGGLDIVRLIGFYLGYMPGNMPRMFGVLIMDTMAIGPDPLSDFVGSLYHFWVGACFGLTLTLIGGKVRWWWGLIWGIIIEIGMMTTSPMVVAMDTGYFGVKFGPGLFIVSFTAHLVLGILMGLLTEKYVSHKGNIFQLVKSLLINK